MDQDTNFWYELGKFLEDRGLGTLAEDIFVGKLPADPDNLIAVTTNQFRGNKPVPDFNVIQKPRIQVLVRNKDFGAGADKMEAVRAVLQATVNVRLPHWRILSFVADQEGGPMGDDEQGRAEFAVSYIVIMHRINA